MPAEGRALTSGALSKMVRVGGLAMSLETPEKIRTFQRKLYCKAKAEPSFRFYLLYDKICREDILQHAYALARANAGAPGVDRESFAAIEAAGVEKWLAGLREELISKTYRPAPVRRVMIPKPGGGERPLGIPTIRCRVVQTAAKLVLEPIFEADLENSAYGYRPRRDATDAVKEVHRLICRGYTDAVDADLSQYFDSIPHSDLLKSVTRRIVDRHVLRLIKMWLKAPVEERDSDGKRRMTGGRRSTRGTPQGGVVSPMLANVYMNRFLKHWRLMGCHKAFRAHVVAYADDFVILSRGHAAEALTWTKAVMTKLGLTLNEAKTSLRDVRTESFSFLGYSFGPHRYRKDGHWYLGASPSKRSVHRIKTKIGELLVPSNCGPWPEIRGRLNALLRGWSAYFSYGTRMPAYRAIDNHVYDHVRHFLVRRHKVSGRGTREFASDRVFGELGVLHLRRVHLGPPPCAIR
jgi:RNA-directed DNA polymerase